jgi:hypothetical protein
MHIFVDISANPQSQVAVGCYLILENLNINLPTIKPLIQSIQLTSTTSTMAELELIDRILQMLPRSERTDESQPTQIILYTDCNNFYNLFVKRSYSLNHRHAELYARLLDHITRLSLIVVKATGHSKKELQVTPEQQIFAVIDKFARKLLRKQIKN